MFAMVLKRARTELEGCELPTPPVAPDQVLLEVGACGICRTDLHVLDGELKEPSLPLVPGHQIVGRVVARGAAVQHQSRGVDRARSA